MEAHFGGRKPHEWQLDTTESIRLGLDIILISLTGLGKSLPFIIPLAKYPNRKIVVISPLIARSSSHLQRFLSALSSLSKVFWPPFYLMSLMRPTAYLNGVEISTLTLNWKALAEVTLSLKMNLNNSFFLNRGNDHPNITYRTKIIKSS